MKKFLFVMLAPIFALSIQTATASTASFEEQLRARVSEMEAEKKFSYETPPGKVLQQNKDGSYRLVDVGAVRKEVVFVSLKQANSSAPRVFGTIFAQIALDIAARSPGYEGMNDREKWELAKGILKKGVKNYNNLPDVRAENKIYTGSLSIEPTPYEHALNRVEGEFFPKGYVPKKGSDYRGTNMWTNMKAIARPTRMDDPILYIAGKAVFAALWVPGRTAVRAVGDQILRTREGKVRSFEEPGRSMMAADVLPDRPPGQVEGTTTVPASQKSFFARAREAMQIRLWRKNR